MSGTTEIERHSRWLMHSYPRRYRKDRADEILDTLLEATGPGRAWPSFRDSRALVRSGLRVRSGLQLRQSAAANVVQGLLLAAVLVIAGENASNLGLLLGHIGNARLTAPFAVGYGVVSALFVIVNLATLATIAGAWFGPVKVIAVVALGLTCLSAYAMSVNVSQWEIAPIVAFGLIAVVVSHRVRLPRLWLWLAGAWYLMNLLPGLVFTAAIRVDLILFGPVAIFAATIAWCAVDLRPMLAVGMVISVSYGEDLVLSFEGPGLRGLWPWELVVVTSITLVIVAMWRLRRQAVL